MKLPKDKKISVREQPLWVVVPSISLASTFSLLGGIGIELVSEKLITIIPLLVSLPTLNTLVGDYATVIAAHAGDQTENSRSQAELFRAIMLSVILSVIGVIALSTALSLQRGNPFDTVLYVKFAVFVAVAVTLVVLFMYLITTIMSKVFKDKKLNPDDILIPVVTSVSDVAMLGSIAIAAQWLF